MSSLHTTELNQIIHDQLNMKQKGTAKLDYIGGMRMSAQRTPQLMEGQHHTVNHSTQNRGQH